MVSKALICSENRAVFCERSPRENASFEDKIMAVFFILKDTLSVQGRVVRKPVNALTQDKTLTEELFFLV